MIGKIVYALLGFACMGGAIIISLWGWINAPEKRGLIIAIWIGVILAIIVGYTLSPQTDPNDEQ